VVRFTFKIIIANLMAQSLGCVGYRASFEISQTNSSNPFGATSVFSTYDYITSYPNLIIGARAAAQGDSVYSVGGGELGW